MRMTSEVETNIVSVERIIDYSNAPQVRLDVLGYFLVGIHLFTYSDSIG